MPATFAAEAAFLVAAERTSGIEFIVGVRPNNAGAEFVHGAYDGWKPTVEWDGAGNFQAWNLYGAGPDEILWRYQTNVGHLRYHLDERGNVAFILDGGGNGLEKYTYDAFGRATVTDWWGNPHYDAHGYASWYGNRFMFQGREYLSELGIYDFRNRMYQPDLGRFLQMDPMGFDAGDMNLFRYCGDNPVNGHDPMGLDQGGGNDHAHDYDWNDRTVWDYSYDVRYGVMDDLLGWEAAPYIREQFAMVDAASQAFDAYSSARYEASRGFEGYDPGTGASIYRAQPVLIDGHLVARAQPVLQFHVGIGTPVGLIPRPNSGFPEAYNPTGKGWVYGWQGSSGYAPFGAQGGYQVVILANGQCGFFVYGGGGAGVGTPGYLYYEGTVSDVHWLSDYAGGFVSLSANFFVGGSSSISPDNGAATSGITYGTPGGGITVDYFSLRSVWWGRR